ncbi:histidine kinase [Pseudonocardia sp. H11422]|uniref:HAMP domain-containing sensor histidine kinase n=1 Tax=Pseudonocardia sp. H11422 TaxID=2835866 RepID=UPI001BDCC364|nr:histidine kinase [Pseudonocardia sp. H11422]
MSGLVDQRPQRDRNNHWASRTPAAALFRRLFLVTGLVFVVGAAVLVVSPATVSTPVLVWEAIVLTVGLALMLAVNALLLRASLKPLDGLTALMERVDLLRPGERLAVRGNGDVAHLIHTFNDMLDRLEAERGASSARALAAQEGERQRIAQELHDEIGQSLTAVLLGLKRTVDRAPRDLQDELRGVQEMIRASLGEVRQVARRLRPGVLDDLGLLSAMSALATDFSEASEVPVARRLVQRLPALSRDTELVLYRIAQESLTNIARHAEASWVELSLSRERDGVALRITDDGRGMNGCTEGAGIRGMRERAILIGARLTLRPVPTGGTEVRLDVPVGAERG